MAGFRRARSARRAAVERAAALGRGGGGQDSQYLPQAQQVFAAGQAAGMDVQLHVRPGGHSFEVWGPGLEEAMPWLSTRLGMTP